MTDYIRQPFEKFIKHEASSSILLLAATILALILANTGLSSIYQDLLTRDLSIGFGEFLLSKDLIHWINDGLMAVFFFVIGLEIKRELLVGELSEKRKAVLPVAAAIGGVLIPILLFLILNRMPEARSGWAIPMATDIAFSLGILKLLGNKVPNGLKIFLVAFAIVDDLMAVVTIAIFYSQGIQWGHLILAAGLFMLLIILNRFRWYSTYFFLFIGVIIWYLLLKSGVHATIAGVMMAFTIPMRRQVRLREYKFKVEEALAVLHQSRKGKSVLNHAQLDALDEIESLSKQVVSPLQYLENKLHGWVAFLIMPLFALANAGVSMADYNVSLLNLSLSIGIALVLGKFMGIGLFAWMAVKVGWAQLPQGVSQNQILAVSFLGGIGFTMSLFLTGLAYSDPSFIDAAKAGIILASLLAGVMGYFLVRSSLRNVNQQAD